MYYALSVTPLFHAFVDLDEKFTKNLILLRDIGCISSPTNQQCDAYWTKDPTRISLIVSTYIYSVMVQSNLLTF